jgi:hypothetical protein
MGASRSTAARIFLADFIPVPLFKPFEAALAPLSANTIKDWAFVLDMYSSGKCPVVQQQPWNHDSEPCHLGHIDQMAAVTAFPLCLQPVEYQAASAFPGRDFVRSDLGQTALASKPSTIRWQRAISPAALSVLFSLYN